LDKAPDAFRTISEVAGDLDLPQHVLRFWESRFAQIRPMKRAGGRRYYRPDDVDLLRGIRHLLYGEGYTIRGVQRILREQGPKFVQAVWQPGAAQPGPPTSEDQVADDTDHLPSDGTARNVFGMLKPAPAQIETDVRGALPASVSIAPAAPTGLRTDELRKLQAALDELGECRRMIDAALRSDAA
jgi:DNA-binding transcriptional MerR regulator